MKVRHITLPGGFVAAGAAAGIKTTGDQDVTIIAAKSDASAAVMTTQNQVIGAPVAYCRSVMPKGYGTARGIVVNSGNSNVCTGAAGKADAKAMAAQTAKLLGTSAKKVLVASTGIIGHPLPMTKIRRGISAAASHLGVGHDAAALRGIMTTDTREKSAVVQSSAGKTRFTVAGIAKGAGMIAPQMATLISIVTTDLAISPAALHKALKAAVSGSFNALTIDSDTSTSDTIAIFASGAAGNKPLTARSAGFAKFVAALSEVCGVLVRACASDGEGATKLIEVEVKGARTDAEAKQAAMSVADSPLFKCAVNGGDPNWGRIVMALGKSPARVVAEKLTVKIGEVTVFARGKPAKFSVKRAEKQLAGSEVNVLCDLHLGEGRFTAITCDMSREYVAIKADYHT